MKLSSAALFIYPVAVGGWSMIPYSSPLLGSILDVETPFGLVRKQRQQSLDRLFKDPAFKKRSSPAYEITNSDEIFEVAIDVPGIEPGNVNVTIDKDVHLLIVSGKRESASEGYSFSSQFSQSFYLDPSVDTELFTASLKGVVLVVSAPKDTQHDEKDSIQKIPITSHEDEKEEIDTATTEERDEETSEEQIAAEKELQTN